MGILANIRHWFDKRSAVMTVAETTLEQMTKFNALVRSDPEDIIRAIDEFNCGYLAPMARLIGDYEQRDDKMRVSSIKMASAVSRCGWSVRPKKGFEDDPDAARQVEVLERFWSTVRVTDAFKRNERGGLALLKEQMMSAQSYGFAVHDLSWKPLANGEIEATFTSVPLWKFENRTGELRYIPQVGGWDGVEMKRGEWMVSTGDGIGIAAAICACMKRLGLTNWLVFTDRCVLPLIHGKTGAAYGSEQWNNLQKALKNINRLARVVTDPSTDINAIQMDGGKQNPFGPLIDWCDRAIVTLYRGGDLGTISRPDAVGGLGQLDEVDALEQRSCVRITETLNEQVSSFVVDYVLNRALKAEIVIEPVSKPDVKQDMEIDDHLAKYGVKLSKTDALARYGRAEAAEDDPGDAMELVQGADAGNPAFPGRFANESGDPNKALNRLKAPSSQLQAPKTPLQTHEKALQIAPSNSDGQGDPSGQPPAQIAKNRPSTQSAVIDAFVKQNSEAAKAVRAVVDNPSEGAFAQLLANLPTLLPTDPALAAVIADEMAKTYGAASASSRQSRPSRPSRDNLANSTDAQGNKHDDGNGQFTEKGGGSAAKKDSPTKPAADKAGATGDSGSSGAPAEAAKAVRAVVDNPSEGAFAQLLAKLPALLPTDPALAAVIADEMAKTYGESLTQRRGEAEVAESLANEFREEDHPRAEDGKFTDGAGDDIDGEDVEPSWITPVNDISDEDKLERLTEDMKANGWQGRPILAINDDGDHWQALTGSHRVAAAEAAGIPVKVAKVDEDQLKDLSKFFDESGSGIDFDEWMSLDDQGKSEWLGKAVGAGYTSLKEPYTLMAREERENQKNY